MHLSLFDINMTLPTCAQQSWSASFAVAGVFCFFLGCVGRLLNLLLGRVHEGTIKFKFFKKCNSYNDLGDSENTKRRISFKMLFPTIGFLDRHNQRFYPSSKMLTVTWNFFQEKVHFPFFFGEDWKSVYSFFS